MILKDPTAAAVSKPALPPTGSSYLDTAAQQIDAALAGPKLSDAQRTALLAFLIEIHGQRTADKGPHAHEGRLAQVEQSGITGGDLKSDHGNTDHGGHADHGDEADAENLRKSGQQQQ